MGKYLVSFFIVLGSCAAFAAEKPKVIVTVSLSKNLLWIQKHTRKGLMTLSAQTIPVTPGSVRVGTYKPLQLSERFRTVSGNVFLENYVRFAGDANIRTSRMFEQWKKSGRPATNAVVIEPELGSILFDTIRAYGLSKTVIRITR